ncbi:MAG: TldD/PmbA family protein [Fibrobacteria bacterium]|nr:TldD/PmbA family protein [Fibrobacteria bacterium]
MENTLAQNIIQSGLDRGADFVEIFEEEARNASVVFKDKKVESARAGTEYGIGIRLVYGFEVLYGFTSKANEEELLTIVRSLALSKGISADTQKPPITLAPVSVTDIHTVTQDPRVVGQEHKLPLLKRADEAARNYSTKISQVSVSASDMVSDIYICNSDGLVIEDSRVRSRFSISVTAGENGDIFAAREAPGSMQGFEFLEGLDCEKYALQAAQRAELMLSAGYIKGKQMPVIMGNGFGGVIFHEACGHPLETESIRRKASPFIGKLGQSIAHSKVTAIDDGTIANGWGSSNIDDEGNPTQKTVLIENGILKSYMSDKVSASELNLPVTGSSRRESYKYAPVSRMRNTYIAAGTDSFEDMVTSVDDGLYAKKMGGGSVNPATGEFNFVVEEGYIIEGGKIKGPVRGATLIGKGHEILPMISMVGTDLELAAGMCGASSGLIPASVGQPTLKVDNILVGGR